MKNYLLQAFGGYLLKVTSSYIDSIDLERLFFITQTTQCLPNMKSVVHIENNVVVNSCDSLAFFTGYGDVIVRGNSFYDIRSNSGIYSLIIYISMINCYEDREHQFIVEDNYAEALGKEAGWQMWNPAIQISHYQPGTIKFVYRNNTLKNFYCKKYF